MLVKNIYKILIFPYTLFLLYLMFFGFGREQMSDNIVRFEPIYSTLKFIEKQLLFKRYFSLIINLIGNFIMFVPFGFLGWIFPKYKSFKRLIIDFLTAIIIIEFLQYISRMGVFDIDDILLNSVGVGVGFWVRKDKIWEKFAIIISKRNVR